MELPRQLSLRACERGVCDRGHGGVIQTAAVSVINMDIEVRD
jgi:hypothetical protein